MFSLTVRDHFMIAHSFNGEIFGPAQHTHGATYVVDVSFMRAELDDDDLVIDIGLASDALKRTLGELNMRNLDDVDEFKGRNTTTEFLAKAVFDRLRAAMQAGDLGDSARSLAAMRVTLAESHIAWASYEGDV
jgi:6-pyruvoyl-tetrahydropterin synthase